jgi:glutaryl-CoA dehydrogenase
MDGTMTHDSAVHDFLGIDDLLSDEDRAIRDTVRDFARSELAPHIAEWYDEGTLPDDLGPRLGKLGLLGMHLDGYGCAGTSATAYGVACRELEAVDSGLRSFVSVQGSLAMFAIHRWGSEEQKEEWLARMATGEAIGCFGLTEPDAGSDPGSMKTRARRDPSAGSGRDGGDWVLNGSKMWITNGTLADVAIVWAQTDEGIRGFVVPTDTEGFGAHKIRRKLSLRASVSAELTFDDLRLPAAAAFPEVRGLKGPLSCLNEARYGIVWGVVGAARACLEESLAYTREREQFGKPLASFQLTQRKLALMTVAVNNAALVAWRLGALKDAGTLTPTQVSYGKYANVRAALDVAREARTTLGAAGITLDHTVMRHMNNLETVMTYEGTEEMHLLSVGGELTGIPAFR